MAENIITQKVVLDTSSTKKGFTDIENSAKATASEISKLNAKQLKDENLNSRQRTQNLKVTTADLRKSASEQLNSNKAVSDEVKRSLLDRLTASRTLANEIKKNSVDQVNSNKAVKGSIVDNTLATKNSTSAFSALGFAVKGFFAIAVVSTIVDYMKLTIETAKKAEASFTAFSSVVKAKNISMASSMETVNFIAKDGAISISQTQLAMQNLLQRGYSVNQAKEALDILRNAAAFGKAGHLEFGEAIVSATEGLRQENSILVDNAGITTNVSKMWERYAKVLGVTAQELTTNQKIEAEMMGMREEAAIHMGNYEKMLSTASGKETLYRAELNKTAETIGTQLLPAYSSLIQSATSLLKLTSFIIAEYKKTKNVFSHENALEKLKQDYEKGIVSTEQYHRKMENISKSYKKNMDRINDEASGATALGYGQKEPEKPKTEKDVLQDKAKEAKFAKEVLEKEKDTLLKAEQDKVEIELESHKNSLIELEISHKDKLISYENYIKEVKRLLQSIEETETKVTANKISVIETKNSNASLTEEQKSKGKASIVKLKSERLNDKLKYVNNMASVNEGTYGRSRSSGGSGKTSIEYKSDYINQVTQNELDEFKRNNKNEVTLNEQKYEDFLISAEDYFSKKKALSEESFAYDLNLKKKEKEAIEILKPKSEQEKYEQLTKIAKITNEINDLQNSRLNVEKDITREQTKYNEQKQKTKDLMEAELNLARQLAGVDGEESKVNAASNLGLISGEQKIQAEQYFVDQRYEINKASIQKQMDLYNKNSSEYENYLKQLQMLDINYSKDKQNLAIDSIQNQLENTKRMMETFESGLINIATSFDGTSKSLVEGFKNMGQKIMQELIAIEAKILARKIISQLFGISLDGNQAKPGGVFGIAGAGMGGNQSSLANSLLGGILGGGNNSNNSNSNSTTNNNVTQNITIQGGASGGGDKSTLSQIFNGIGDAISGAFKSIG